jgi:hypothetical protein
MNDDDLSKKIQQIAELLGQDSMPDNVKGLLSVLTGSLSGKEDSPANAAGAEQENDERSSPPAEAADTYEMLDRAKQLMNKMGMGNDPRINLLHAIKPFMGNKRQQKISTCIKILQMASLTKLMDFKDK